MLNTINDVPLPESLTKEESIITNKKIKTLRVSNKTKVGGLWKAIKSEVLKSGSVIVTAIGPTSLLIAHKSISFASTNLCNENNKKVYILTEREFKEGNELLIFKVSDSPSDLYLIR